MNLLFCADQSANYSEMSRLVTAFAARGHTCLFLFPTSDARDPHYATVLEDLEKKQADGTISHVLLLDLDDIARISARTAAVPQVVVAKPAIKRPRPPSGRRSAALRVKGLAKGAVRETLIALHKSRNAIARHSLVRSAVSIAYMCRYYGKVLEGIDEITSPYKIDAILLPEEVTSPYWSGILKFARTKSVPVVICPYTICNQEEAFQSLKNSPAFQSSTNRVAAKLFPAWRMRREGHDIVRLPQPHIIAHEWHRMSPRDPWMMNSGSADRICVESAAIKTYFEASGIPRERLVVTGSPAVDEIYGCRASASEALDELRRSADWRETKPILLVGGCPNQLTAKVPTCMFSSMQEIAAFVANAIEPIAADYHLVFRPHPSYLDFGPIMARHGFHTSMIPTQRLIAISSLYVAFASATIRWAICAGVPTVNFDVFGYRYQEFANVPGVMSTDAPARFKDIMSELSYGSPAYNECKKQLSSNDGDWTLLDGKSMQRLESVLHELTATRSSGKPTVAQVRRVEET